MKNPLPSVSSMLSMLFVGSKEMLHGKAPKPERGIVMAAIDKSLCFVIALILAPFLIALMTLVVLYLSIMGVISFGQWLWENEKIKEWRKS